MENVLNVIHPYRYEGMWVFDDDRVGLIREPFVEGADTIIDQTLELKAIRDPEQGFRLIFSSTPFPKYDLKLTWLGESDGGNYYWSEEFTMQGWLCPALMKYFDSVPREIYARFEDKET